MLKVNPGFSWALQSLRFGLVGTIIPVESIESSNKLLIFFYFEIIVDSIK